jgi:hypothetical protein
MASKNIYTNLKDSDTEEEGSDGEASETGNSNDSEVEFIEEESDIEESEEMSEDGIVTIDINGETEEWMSRLTRENLVSRGPTPDTNQRYESTINWLQARNRPTGWHIQLIPDSVDEMIVAMAFAAEQISMWYKESRPRGTLLACRQALYNYLLTSDDRDIQSGVYGQVLRDEINNDPLTKDGLHQEAKARTAARLTRLATDEDSITSSIYVEPTIAESWINRIIRNRSRPKTKKHLDKNPIVTLTGHDKQIMESLDGREIDVFVKWEKGKTEVWTRNCRRIIPKSTKQVRATHSNRMKKVASESTDLRKFFQKPPTIPESNDRTVNSTIRTRTEDESRATRASRLARIKSPEKGKGHREDDKIP